MAAQRKAMVLGVWIVICGIQAVVGVNAGAATQPTEKLRDAPQAYMVASIIVCQSHPKTVAELQVALKGLGFVADSKGNLIFEDSRGQTVVRSVGDKNAHVTYSPPTRSPMPEAVFQVLSGKAQKVLFTGPESLTLTFDNGPLVSSRTGRPECSSDEQVEIALADGAWLSTTTWIRWD